MNTRRDMVFGSLGLFAAYALLGEMDAAALPRRMTAKRWVLRQNELARALAAGTLSQTVWHAEIARLAREVDVAELMAEVGRARLREAGAPFGHDPVKRYVSFVGDDGSPMQLAYGVALFAFASNNVITPHAHKHMASAHMVVEGKVRIRTFDRVGEEGGALLIRLTADHVAGVGEAAAMTSAKDNVHWFTPKSKTALTFDVILDGLDAGEDRYLIQPIDPLGGKHRPDGTMRAPLLSFEDSMARYTAAM